MKPTEFLKSYNKFIIAALCFSLVSFKLIEFYTSSSTASALEAKHSNLEKQTAKNKAQSNKSLEILSLSSINQKAVRTTVLGKAKGLKTHKHKETSVLINDPNMSEKWGLKLTDSSSAWKITRGSKKIVVAVIDTGMDIKHEDLADNRWVNPGESGKDSKGRDKSRNGVDDDKNGYVDDLYGWNFVSNDHSLTDNHGHGTHISGILGAVGGNGKGISGVSPKISIMTLKYFDPKSLGANNLENTVKAIHYAIENGAQIINYSGGGLEFSAQEKKAIERAQKKGILFVAAAGNERSNSDQNKYYPADYELDNIISVTAIDTKTQILPSSNYGKVTVDIAAPGKSIYSTLPNGRYGRMTGTSQATAFVSGVAALLMAHNPDYNAQKVAKYIKQTGDVIDSLKGKTRYNRKLNSYRALSILDQGVAATGVVADNISNLPAKSFASDKFSYQEERTGDENSNLASMKSFSSQLMKALKGKKRSLNSDRAPNSKAQDKKSDSKN